MADSIEGRAALVTGASSGLGRHMALSLARGGAHVALTARRIGRLESLAEEIAAFGGRAVPIALDVTDAASVAAGVAAAEDALGALTILVNNAGIAEAKWLLDHDERAFDRIMDTNLKGAWLVATEVGTAHDPPRAGRCHRQHRLDRRRPRPPPALGPMACRRRRLSR